MYALSELKEHYVIIRIIRTAVFAPHPRLNILVFSMTEFGAIQYYGTEMNIPWLPICKLAELGQLMAGDGAKVYPS